ncbi:MAG TPA: hypothetical protein VFU55_14335 [Terracidiphilus sp.]|nr:hypothetical protein [Terracidiphilus sp.]
MTTSAGVSYTFDGNFERVMDTSPKLYWYGLDGSVLAQTDGSGNPVNEYIYFDAMRIARRDASGNVYYSFGNELGSPTVTTAAGSPGSRSPCVPCIPVKSCMRRNAPNRLIPLAQIPAAFCRLFPHFGAQWRFEGNRSTSTSHNQAES